MVTNPEKLVDTHGLLEAVFEKKSRPSERWLRTQMRRRAIPYLKLGRLIRFDVEKVREALAGKFTVQPRGLKGTAQ